MLTDTWGDGLSNHMVQCKCSNSLSVLSTKVHCSLVTIVLQFTL